MKRIGLLILMLLITSGSLMGCKKDTPIIDEGSKIDSSIDNNEDIKDISDSTNIDDVADEYQIFEADVIESGEWLLIAPDVDSTEYTSSDKISVATIETEIIDEKGNVIEVNILEPGDRIKVLYNGVIAESYPAQITAAKIELLGHNYIVDGFFALIDDVYQDDSALNSDITMIAFDTRGWTSLSKAETDIILAMAQDKYELEIVKGSFDELAEQGLIDKENLYFENGIIIEMEDITINNNRDKIKCSIRKWRSGLGAIGWDAEAKLIKEEWKISRDNMWIS